MRAPSITILALFLLAPFATAQTTIATPAGKGFETKDGGDQLATGWNIGYAYKIGGTAAGRYQYIDDEITGTLRVFKSVAFRMDNKSHTTSSAAGRSWSNVSLQMGELPFANISTTFANNLISPTTVFSGSVNWPSYTGYVSTVQPPTPAPIQAAHTFPFTSVWVYSGTSAIVKDFTFTGGTLANNAAWTSSLSTYHLDGAIIVTSMGTGASRFPSTASCHDSAHGGPSTSTPAQMVTQYNQYSKAFKGTIPADSIEVPIQSRYTAPSAPVIHGVGLAGLNNGAGVAIGFACNNLILDTSAFITLGATAGALPNAESPRLLAYAPRTPANLGLQIWMQGAWTDSVTNAPSLTTASRAMAPTLGMTEVLPKKVLVSSTSSSATTGSRDSDANWTSFPLTFYIQ